MDANFSHEGAVILLVNWSGNFRESNLSWASLMLRCCVLVWPHSATIWVSENDMYLHDCSLIRLWTGHGQAIFTLVSTLRRPIPTNWLQLECEYWCLQFHSQCNSSAVLLLCILAAYRLVCQNVWQITDEESSCEEDMQALSVGYS